VPDTRRDRAVSTFLESSESWSTEGIPEVFDCRRLACCKEDGSLIGERPEVVSESELWVEVVEAGCRILDLAIKRERKLGRGGGTSSSSSPFNTGSAGIFRLS
jgi:hypothetical protein